MMMPLMQQRDLTNFRHLELALNLSSSEILLRPDARDVDLLRDLGAEARWMAVEEVSELDRELLDGFWSRRKES